MRIHEIGMLAAIPLDEHVMLNVTYEIDTGAGKVRTESPLSRTLLLREAIRQSVGLVRTGASVSITARGATYGYGGDPRNLGASRFP